VCVRCVVWLQWHSLDRSQQARYYEMAKRERLLHKQLFPGWTARDNYSVIVRRVKRKAAMTQRSIQRANNSEQGLSTDTAVIIIVIITALRWMQGDLVRRNLSVCLSVRPSVKRVYCDRTEERHVQIFIPYERSFSLVFWQEEWLVGATPSTWNFGSTGPRWSKIADSEPIFARSASAITLSEIKLN